MNAKVIVLLVLPAMASAQGFAGLGTSSDGFATPQSPAIFDFPFDHGPHPDYRIEWWYLTANLEGADGTSYGLQWTLFRSALAPEVGRASYYYSQPFYQIEGTLTLPDGPVAVTGDAWLDREWSSQPLSDDQTGWDWFSLSLENGKLMGFRLRQTDGSFYTSATWIDPNGETTAYGDGAFYAEPTSFNDVDGKQIPTQWNVRLDAQAVDVDVYALTPEAWMDTSIPYWEGPIIVEGSHTGRGYLEMTGYE